MIAHSGIRELSFDEVSQLKIGDTIYECEYGNTIEAVLVSEPVVTTKDKYTQVSFVATRTDSDDKINYLMTRGLEHYGPKIYPEDAYIVV